MEKQQGRWKRQIRWMKEGMKNFRLSLSLRVSLNYLRFFLINGLEKHFFKENLGSLKMGSMKNGFHVWKNNFRSALAVLWMEVSLNLVSLHNNEVNKLIDV